MQALKQKFVLQRTAKRIKKLWQDYLQVCETQEALDMSKLHTLGAFMEQVLAADPELPTMMDQLIDDSTELIATLLNAAESASQLKASATADSDELAQVADAVNKALTVAELCLRQEQYREKIRVVPDIISRVLGVLDMVESAEEKGLVLRILGHLASSVEGKLELGRQQGFKKIIDLVFRKDPALTAQILRTLKDFLTLQQISLAGRAPEPELTSKGLNVAMTVVNELLKLAPLTSAWLTPQGHGPQQSTQTSPKASSPTQRQTGLVVLSTAVLQQELARIEQLAAAEALPAESDESPILSPTSDVASKGTVNTDADTEQRIIRELMRVQGALEGILQMFTQVASEVEGLEVLQTLQGLLIKNMSAQSDFRQKGGYSALFTLLDRLVLQARSCTQESMCREFQKFMSNVFSLLESIILDGNVATGTEIKNLDALQLLTMMIDHASTPDLVQGAAALLDRLLLLRTPNLVALEHAGAVRACCALMMQLAIGGDESDSQSSAAAAAAGVAPSVEQQTAAPIESRYQGWRVGERWQTFRVVDHFLRHVAVVSSARDATVLACYTSIIVLGACCPGQCVQDMEIHVDHSSATSDASFGFRTKCCNCETDHAVYRCLHADCANGSTPVQNLCFECDHVLHKAVAKRSHVRIPFLQVEDVLEVAMAANPLLREVVPAINCVTDFIRYPFLAMLATSVCTLLDDRRARYLSVPGWLLESVLLALSMSALPSQSQSAEDRQLDPWVAALGDVQLPEVARMLPHEPPEDCQQSPQRILLSQLLQCMGRFVVTSHGRPVMRNRPPAAHPDFLHEFSDAELNCVVPSPSFVYGNRAQCARLLALFEKRGGFALLAHLVVTDAKLPLTSADRCFTIWLLREAIVSSLENAPSRATNGVAWMCWLLQAAKPNSKTAGAKTAYSPRRRKSASFRARLGPDGLEQQLHYELAKATEGFAYAAPCQPPVGEAVLHPQIHFVVVQELRNLIGGDSGHPSFDAWVQSCPLTLKCYNAQSSGHRPSEDDTVSSVHEADEEDSDPALLMARVPVTNTLAKELLLGCDLLTILQSRLEMVHAELTEPVARDGIAVAEFWNLFSCLTQFLVGFDAGKEAFDAMAGTCRLTEMVLAIHPQPPTVVLDGLIDTCLTGDRYLPPAPPFVKVGALSRLWRKVPTLTLPVGSGSGSFRMQHHHAQQQQQCCLHDFLVGSNPVYFTYTSTVDNILACLRPRSLDAQMHPSLLLSREDDDTDDQSRHDRVSVSGTQSDRGERTPRPSVAESTTAEEFSRSSIGRRMQHSVAASEHSDGVPEFSEKAQSEYHVPSIGSSLAPWGLADVTAELRSNVHADVAVSVSSKPPSLANMKLNRRLHLSEDTEFIQCGVDHRSLRTHDRQPWASWEPSFGSLMFRSHHHATLLFAAAMVIPGEDVTSVKKYLLRVISTLLDANPCNAAMLTNPATLGHIVRLMPNLPDSDRPPFVRLVSQCLSYDVKQPSFGMLLRLAGWDSGEIRQFNEHCPQSPMERHRALSDDDRRVSALQDHQLQLLYMLGVSAEREYPRDLIHFAPSDPIVPKSMVHQIDKLPPAKEGMTMSMWIRFPSSMSQPYMVLFQLVGDSKNAKVELGQWESAMRGSFHRRNSSSPAPGHTHTNKFTAFFRQVEHPVPEYTRQLCFSFTEHRDLMAHYDYPMSRLFGPFLWPDVVVEYPWKPNDWHLLAVTIGSTLHAYVDGKEAPLLARQNEDYYPMNSSDATTTVPSQFQYLEVSDTWKLAIGGLLYEEQIIEKVLDELIASWSTDSTLSPRTHSAPRLTDASSLNMAYDIERVWAGQQLTMLRAFCTLVRGFCGDMTEATLHSLQVGRAETARLHAAGSSAPILDTTKALLGTIRALASTQARQMESTLPPAVAGLMNSTFSSMQSPHGQDAAVSGAASTSTAQTTTGSSSNTPQSPRRSRRVSRSLSPAGRSNAKLTKAHSQEEAGGTGLEIRTTDLGTSRMLELFTLLNVRDELTRHPSGSGGDYHIVVHRTKTLADVLLESGVNVHILYPFVVAGRSQQVAAVRLITALLMISELLYEKFLSDKGPAMLSYHLASVPLFLSRDTMQILCEAVVADVTTRSSIESDTQSSGLMNNRQLLRSPQMLRACVDVVATAALTRKDLLKLFIEWSIDVADEGMHENLTMIFEHFGIMPLLFVLVGCPAEVGSTADLRSWLSSVDNSGPCLIDVKRAHSRDTVHPIIARWLRLLLTGTSTEAMSFASASIPPAIAAVGTSWGLTANHVAALCGFVAFCLPQLGAVDAARRRGGRHLDGVPEKGQAIAPHSAQLLSGVVMVLEQLIRCCASGDSLASAVVRNAMLNQAGWYFLLELFDSVHSAVRVCAIRLLTALITTDKGAIDTRLVAQFERLNGFACMAEQLARHEPDGELVDALLALLFKPSTPTSDAKVTQTPVFSAAARQQLDAIEEVESVMTEKTDRGVIAAAAVAAAAAAAAGGGDPRNSDGSFGNDVSREETIAETEPATVPLHPVDNKQLSRSSSGGEDLESKEAQRRIHFDATLEMMESGAVHAEPAVAAEPTPVKTTPQVEPEELPQQQRTSTPPERDGTFSARSSEGNIRPKSPALPIATPSRPLTASTLQGHVQMIRLPQIIPVLLSALRSAKHSQLVYHSLAHIEQALIPYRQVDPKAVKDKGGATAGAPTGADAATEPQSESVAESVHDFTATDMNLDAIFLTKDWLINVYDCVKAFVSRSATGTLLESSGLFSASSENESGAESDDSNEMETGASMWSDMHGRRDHGVVESLDAFCDPLYNLAQRLILYELRFPFKATRKFFDVFRLPLPEARTFQQTVLNDILEAFEAAPQLPPEYAGNILKNLSAMLEQLPEKSEPSLDLYVRAIHVIGMLNYHNPPEIRQKLKETQLLELRNQYVFRCLAATDFEADLFTRVSTVMDIDTALESLVTCSSGTNRESNVVVLLLGLLLESADAQERDLELGVLRLLQGLVEANEESRKQLAKILHDESLWSALLGAFRCETVPQQFVPQPPPAPTSWWASWLGHSQSNDPPAEQRDVARLDRASEEYRSGDEEAGVGASDRGGHQHSLDDHQNPEHLTSTETRSLSMFLDWFHAPEQSEIRAELAKRVRKLVQSITRTAERIAEKLAQRRAKSTRQIQDRLARANALTQRTVADACERAHAHATRAADRFVESLLKWRNEVKGRIEEGGALYQKKYDQLRASLLAGKVGAGAGDALTGTPSGSAASGAAAASSGTPVTAMPAAGIASPDASAAAAAAASSSSSGKAGGNNTPSAGKQPSKRNSAPAATGKQGSGQPSLASAVEQVQQQLSMDERSLAVPESVLAVMNGNAGQHRRTKQQQQQASSSSHDGLEYNAQAGAFEWLVNSFLMATKP